MRGGWRSWALLAGLMLLVGACSPICTNKTASVTTAPTPTPTPTPVASPTPTPVESPTPTPEASPTPTPPPAPAKLIIINFSLHVGEVGIGYAPVTIGASGGTPPYKWSIDGGALPTGLGFSVGGTVSGTPGTAGGFSSVFRVDDSAGQAAGVQRSITVVPYLTASGLCTQSCSVEQGCDTVCGAYTDIAGGVTPYTFALTGGTVAPPGTSLNGAALAGTFTTPSPIGALPVPYRFSVNVTDALGATSTVNAAFLVFPHIAFVTLTATCGNSPNNCAITSTSTPPITYTGGLPGGKPTPTVTKVGPAFTNPTATITVPPPACFTTAGTTNPTTSPPPGMVTTASGGFMNLSAGPPDGTTWCGYSATITFVLVDQSPCGPSPGQMCTTTNSLSVLFQL